MTTQQKSMTNEERIEKARQWRAAAVERREYTQRLLDAAEDGPEPWWNAQYNIIDGMMDRINLIDGLFPELRDETVKDPSE